jgi:hypothetical protein
MIGLEHHNAFTAMSPTTSTRIPPTVVVINVINLDHRPERWNSVQRLGLDKQDGGFVRLKRFSAVRTQRGWVGCARSHIRLIQEAARNKLPYVVVAEDDIGPTAAAGVWTRRVRAIVEALAARPDEWDVFKGMSSGRFQGNVVEPWDTTLGLYEVNGGSGTDFVVYNASFFPVVDAWEGDLDKHVDDDDAESDLAWDAWVSSHCRNRMLAALPYLTNASADASDIVRGGQVHGLRAMHAGVTVSALWHPTWMATAGNDCTPCAMAIVADNTPNRPCELVNTLESLLGVALGTWAALVLPVVVVTSSGELHPSVQRRYGARVVAVRDVPLATTADYMLRVDAGWVLRRPLCVVQAVRLMRADTSVGVVCLRDINDLPNNSYNNVAKCARSAGGVMHWPLCSSSMLTPCVCRSDGRASSRRSVLLPGGCCIATMRK